MMRAVGATRLGREQENETCYETRDSRLPSKLQALWEKIHERQSEQDPGRNGSERCPSCRSQLPTEQGQKACTRKADSGECSKENRAQQFVLSLAARRRALTSSGLLFDLGSTATSP